MRRFCHILLNLNNKQILNSANQVTMLQVQSHHSLPSLLKYTVLMEYQLDQLVEVTLSCEYASTLRHTHMYTENV